MERQGAPAYLQLHGHTARHCIVVASLLHRSRADPLHREPGNIAASLTGLPAEWPHNGCNIWLAALSSSMRSLLCHLAGDISQGGMTLATRM